MSDGLVMVCDVDLALPDATRTHTIEVARGFARNGLAVDLVARGPDPEIPGVLYRAGAASESSRARRLWAVNARTIALLWRRRGEARRCYVRHYWGQVPVLLAARLLGYRLVTQVDDVPYGRGFEGEIGLVADYARRAAARVMGRLAHGVVAVTSEIRDLLVEQFHVPAERVVVLPNGVDLDVVRPLPRDEAIAAEGLEPGAEYVVFAGRFAHWVDFDVMLDAFRVVADRREGARLLLVGGGEEAPAVDAAVERLGMAERVVRTGFVRERARLVRLLAAARVGLVAHRADHTARIGVSPTKVAEYFAAGRAVVAVDMPSLRDAIEDANAGIVVPRDPTAMGEAVADLLADPERADALGRAGRAAAERGYSWGSIVARTISLFEG